MPHYSLIDSLPLYLVPPVRSRGCGGSKLNNATQTSYLILQAHAGAPEAFPGQMGYAIPLRVSWVCPRVCPHLDMARIPSQGGIQEGY